MKFIETHIHGGFGISFDNADSNQLRTFSKMAYEKGIVAFCPTLTGDKIENLKGKLEEIKIAKEGQKGACDEAIIIGAHLEGTFLSKEKTGIQNKDNFLSPSVENFKKIADKFYDIIKIVVVAPENDGSLDLINHLKSNNIKVHFGHTNTKNIEGADSICHLFNAMETISHKYETAAIKALLDENIYTELIADTIHVDKDVLKLVFKVRPKNKIILISDALPIAGSSLKEIEFCGKKIYKNGRDENGTLGGSIKLLPDIAKILLKKKLLNEDMIYQTAYLNPIDYLKLIV